MDGLSWFFNGFVTVSSVAGSIASVLGFITILASVLGYLITHAVVDPFGDIYSKKPRYHKFFVSLAERVRKRDKTLIAPSVIGGSGVCTFSTTVPGIAYQVHFMGNGQFRVYANLTGLDARTRALTLEAHKAEIMKRLGLTKQFARRLVPGTLDIKEVSPTHYEAAIFYPDLVVIVDEAKKLKQVRKWALRQLVALAGAVDAFVPQAAQAHATLATPQPQPVGASKVS